MKIKYAEYFAGIGAPGKALQNVTKKHGDTCEFVYGFEIDKYARNAFCAIHGIDESKLYHDVTNQLNELPYVDIVFYSPPCQTFSIAGKREGATVDKGNLFYSALQGIKKSKPKYAIMENVANLKNQFKDDFNAMMAALDESGYINYAQVLNSKHYGIPQNRERIFIVSIKKDVYEQGERFEFPKYVENKFDFTIFKKNSRKLVAKTYLKDRDIKLPKGFHFADMREDEGLRVRKENVVPCITTKAMGSNTGTPLVIVNNTIGHLTTEERFLLQGFTKQDHDKAYDEFTRTFGKDPVCQLCKQAGNSITVNVEMELIENLIYQRKQNVQIGMF